MRLTRRGWGVVGIVLFCLVMAAQYGARSLNAVVAPLVLVLLAGAVTAKRADRPTLDRRPVEEGFPGDRRPVRIDVDVDKPLSATVVDSLPDGVRVDGDDHVMATTLTDGDQLAYELEFTDRGRHELGPLLVTVTDIFGLVSRSFTYTRTQPVVVYPTVYDLRGGAKHDLQLLRDAVGRYDREEFDHLREYERGDSLRDIHWKSAAKRPDQELVVKEFVADSSVGSVDLAGECSPGRADDLATATASVATYLLREEVAVGVQLPAASVGAESGEGHRIELLRTLALVGPGELDDQKRREADVLVQADADGARVLVADHEIPFERLTGRMAPRGAVGATGSSGDRVGGASEDDRPDESLRGRDSSGRGDGSGVVGA